MRASLGRVFGDVTWPASAVELAARPAPSLAEIAAELAGFHDRLVAPHWQRMRAVLDADVAYRGGLLADGGARALLHDLHSDLHWDEGVLTISEPDPRFHEVVLGPDGVVIMPSVFGVTPGAVSQHLSVLHRAGLADRTRTGRTVLYQATDLGLALLDPPRPVPSRYRLARRARS